LYVHDVATLPVTMIVGGVVGVVGAVPEEDDAPDADDEDGAFGASSLSSSSPVVRFGFVSPGDEEESPVTVELHPAAKSARASSEADVVEVM
jgi:hypothetical protein